LEIASVLECGPLNVLIGKNNAGKSTILAAIPVIFEHLATGLIARSWLVDRPAEQFTHRDRSKNLQIGVELHMTPEIRSMICDSLLEAAPQLGKSIEQLNHEQTISFIFSFRFDGRRAYQYIESISFGALMADEGSLKPSSNVLLFTPLISSQQLFENHEEVTGLNGMIAVAERVSKLESYVLSSYFSDRKQYGGARFLLDRTGIESEVLTPARRRELSAILDSADGLETLRTKIAGLIASSNEQIEAITRSEISTPLTSYTGDVKVQPIYIRELCKRYGEVPILKLGERKQPIGRKEAARLLQLKVKRGGPERLQVVQQTVKSLLGVSLDAFQGEGTREAAEMDVDNFLAEANGAGIRESLRLILDLELEPSDIVLLEEPEVHLHPGLEFAIHSYLQEKSKTKQFFLTTHSTNFIDTLSPQNIYLMSRNGSGVSICERLTEGDAPIKIPAELGIRLSTVFMFDKIVFVEGPSDEAVLREIAKTIGVDLNGAGVAFIHMGGVANFTHYAAQATLDLLSRRRVRMWFVVDRDERDEQEVKSMTDRLDERAELCVLERRELENFLIEATAVRKFILHKTNTEPTLVQYQNAINKASDELREKVVDIYLEKELLAPVFLRGRGVEGSIGARIESAKKHLEARVQSIEETKIKLTEKLTVGWDVSKAIQCVPGAILLNAICKELGCAFDKNRGDSLKLARQMDAGSVPQQLREILRKLAN
jgi:putative ATP-dependent endonuclease of OLD family